MKPQSVFVLVEIMALLALPVVGQTTPSWQQVNLQNLTVFSIAIAPQDGQTLFVGSNAGLLKSRNGGQQFIRVLGGLPPDQIVMQVRFSPHNPKVLYAATGNTGLYRSQDAGVSWDRILSIPRITLGSIAFDPVNANRMFVATFGQGIFRSIDGGQTFKAINQGLPPQRAGLTVRPIVIDPSDPDIVYAGTDGAGVFRSVDGGNTWQPMNNRIGNQPVPLLIFDPQNPSRLLAGTDRDGVFMSENRAERWVRTLGAFRAYFVVSAVWPAANPQWVFLGSRGNSRGLGAGVLWSQDGAQTFDELDEGLTNRSVRSLVQDPHNPNILYGVPRMGYFA